MLCSLSSLKLASLHFWPLSRFWGWGGGFILFCVLQEQRQFLVSRIVLVANSHRVIHSWKLLVISPSAPFQVSVACSRFLSHSDASQSLCSQLQAKGLTFNNQELSPKTLYQELPLGHRLLVTLPKTSSRTHQWTKSGLSKPFSPEADRFVRSLTRCGATRINHTERNKGWGVVTVCVWNSAGVVLVFSLLGIERKKPLLFLLRLYVTQGNLADSIFVNGNEAFVNILPTWFPRIRQLLWSLLTFHSNLVICKSPVRLLFSTTALLGKLLMQLRPSLECHNWQWCSFNQVEPAPFKELRWPPWSQY